MPLIWSRLNLSLLTFLTSPTFSQSSFGAPNTIKLRTCFRFLSSEICADEVRWQLVNRAECIVLTLSHTMFVFLRWLSCPETGHQKYVGLKYSPIHCQIYFQHQEVIPHARKSQPRWSSPTSETLIWDIWGICDHFMNLWSWNDPESNIVQIWLIWWWVHNSAPIIIGAVERWPNYT